MRKKVDYNLKQPNFRSYIVDDKNYWKNVALRKILHKDPIHVVYWSTK